MCAHHNTPLWGGRHRFQRVLRCLLVDGALRLPRSRAFSKSTNPTQHPQPVKAPKSSTGGGQATVLLSGNKSKSKLKPIVNASANGPNSKVAMPVPNTAPKNGVAVASAAIVEAVHSHSNSTAILPAKDSNEFVREVLTLIHVRLFSHFFTSRSFRLHHPFLLVVVSIDRSLIRGLTLNIMRRGPSVLLVKFSPAVPRIPGVVPRYERLCTAEMYHIMD